MRVLPLRPLPVATESLTDFLERLANANGYRARELWSILASGEYPHEQTLQGVLNGYALPRFSGPADPRVNISVDMFGLDADNFTHKFRRWCPLCVEKAAWLRPIWRLKFMTICEIHQVHLLQTCPICSQPAGMQMIWRGTCDCGTRFSQVVVPAASKLMPLTRALITSLMDSAVLELCGVTAALTTRQIVRMIFQIGRLRTEVNFNRSGQIQGLEDVILAHDFFDEVATLLTDWPNAFWNCLERYVAASPNDSSVSRVFGYLYDAIYQKLREPAFQFWRDAFESFLLNNWHGGLCSRHRLFRKETIEAHHIQGLTRVARIAGIGSGTLKRMVEHDCFPANRFNGPSKRDFITINSMQVAQFIPDPADYLDLRSAARLLGISHTRLRKLMETEFILTDVTPDWTRSKRWHLRRNEVFSFLEEIRRVAVPELSKATSITLNYALRYWRITVPELNTLLKCMRQREISFALAADGLMRDATFGRICLRDWVEKLRKATTDWVSVTAAAELLGLKEEVVYRLVAKNFLVAIVTQKKGGISYKRISLSSLEHFRQEYVSLAALAKQKKTSANALLRQLEARPVSGPNVDGARQYFYRRADVPDEFLPDIRAII